MNYQEYGFAGQCARRMLGKAMIAMVAFSWLSACPETSQAQRPRVHRVNIGPIAEKPQPPPGSSTGNTPMILSITNTKNRSVTITFRDFAAKVSRKTFLLERQTVGFPGWRIVYSMRATDHRIPFDPRVRDHRRQPGAKYVHRDAKGLVMGRTYRYRVRPTIPYEPQPTVLLSPVRTIRVKPVADPMPPNQTPPDQTPPDQTPPDQTPPDQTPPDQTPPDQTPPDQTPPDQPAPVTETIHLKAKQIGRFLRPYVTLSRIAGEITEIEVPEVNGQALQVYFLKPGYKMVEYISDPDATVMLKSGQTSTPSQITELFGTAQKKVHFKFIAFVRKPQGNRPDSVAIKIRSIKTDD